MLTLEKRKIIQTSGNKKIDSTVCTYSQTPMLSCINCESCSGTCYAMKSYKQYPNVRVSWDSNFYLSLEEPELFTQLVIDQLKHTNKEYVRIHVAGDFYSPRYVQCWFDICKALPNKKFWSYTKADVNERMHKALTELNNLPNVNIVDSLPLGRKNYGNLEYLKQLSKDLVEAGESCYICPCGFDDSIKCGKSCTMCHKCKHVLFLEH